MENNRNINGARQIRTKGLAYFYLALLPTNVYKKQNRMRNITISNSYKTKWLIKGCDNYAVTECGKVINVQRGTIINRVVKGYSVGYYIQGKFITLSNLRTQLEKIPKFDCPF